MIRDTIIALEAERSALYNGLYCHGSDTHVSDGAVSRIREITTMLGYATFDNGTMQRSLWEKRRAEMQNCQYKSAPLSGYAKGAKGNKNNRFSH